MPYVFKGLATVTVMVRYLVQKQTELTTLECPVRLLCINQKVWCSLSSNICR